MPQTQEERLSTLEQTVTVLGKEMRDLNHNVTILLGVTAEQGKDIREIKVGLTALSDRLDTFEQRVDRRFEAMDGRFVAIDRRFDAMDKRFEVMDRRFEVMDKRFDAMDRRFEVIDRRFDAMDKRFEVIDGRLDAMDKRFEVQDAKLDKLLVVVQTVASRLE